jgi:hypothetical protein
LFLSFLLYSLTALITQPFLVICPDLFIELLSVFGFCTIGDIFCSFINLLKSFDLYSYFHLLRFHRDPNVSTQNPSLARCKKMFNCRYNILHVARNIATCSSKKN